ncbi:ABC transporter permease [Streptomyces sp. 4N509B]|uniref:ABC transporter permease n=1 Tax=Streptomyces sp. 4N509B TaxID=3457413 RepID=UPI003FD46894
MSATAPPGASVPLPRLVIVVALVIPAVVALALWAFAWPAARTAPNDLPVGVAGPPAATAPAAERLAAQGDGGAFDVHTYPDEASARAAIEDREVYGAVVLGAPDGGPRLLTATAAGPAVAGVLEEMATRLAAESAGTAELTVVDVVPTPEADPRGAAFSSSVLPLALAGIATGAAVAATGLMARGRAVGVGTLALASVVVGIAVTAIGHSWLGVLDGAWWAVAGSIALVVLASAATVAGLVALIGPAGIGVGAIVVMLMGNPWSGAGSAPEMLPDPVGVIGQWLPLGSGATLVRSVAFFDGAAIAFPLAVLAGWTALGLGMAALGVARRRQRGVANAGGPASGEPVAPSPAPSVA